MQASSAVWVRMSTGGESNPRAGRMVAPGGRTLHTSFPGLARSSVLLPLVAFLVAASPDTSPAASPETAPDVEEGLVPDDVGEVWNPAFPSAPVPATPAAAPARKRVNLALLDPVFIGEMAAPRAEFEAGRYEHAVQLLSKTKDSPQVRYLRALAQLRVRPAAAPAAELEALATELPAIADRCRLQAALAREDLGEFDAARRLFATVPPTSRVYPDARFGLARILRRKGEVAAAAEALEPLAAAASPLWG